MLLYFKKNDDYPGPITRPVSDDDDTSYRAGIGLISLPKLLKMTISADGDLDDSFWEGVAAGASQSKACMMIITCVY